MVNYPGIVAAAVFTQGCNFRCPYCHNPQFVECSTAEKYEEQVILEYLEKRRKLIDGLVVSGGEPTLHNGLSAFLEKTKRLGFSNKLDTNGSNPQVLSELVTNGLLYYVAMDIKAPFDKYHLFGFAETGRIKESMEILRDSSITYELRTTCPRELLKPEDLEKIGRLIYPNEIWKLQQFNPKITLVEQYRTCSSYSNEELENILISWRCQNNRQ